MVSSFADELRLVHIPVSVSETADAVAAVRAGDLAERDDLRVALRATMIKRQEHLAAFDALFDVFFGDLRERRTSADAGADAGAYDGVHDAFLAMPVGQLTAVLEDALASDNRLLLRRLAEVGVERFAEIEAGRRVAGRMYLFRVLRTLEVERLTTEARESVSDIPSLLGRNLTRDRVKGSAEYFTSMAELEIRRRLVAELGADEVARLVRPAVPDTIGFMNASSAEIASMREALGPLTRDLARQLSLRQRQQSGRRLDFRRTIRAAVPTDGVPVKIHFKPPTRPRSDVVVIADVSGSVATFARFTLQLLYAMRLSFRRFHAYAFIDGLIDVTDVLQQSATAEHAFAGITAHPGLIWLDGRSDYGHALETFAAEHQSAVGSRTTVLILGDGRNNYRAPQEERLRDIRRQAAHVFWLNPERKANWGNGDSVIPIYERHCDRMVEVATLAQLRDFADDLVRAN